MRGSIMPDPLAMPPTVRAPPGVFTCTAHAFGNGSVVMMACAAAAISARSRTPDDFLIPQCTPAARNPCGAVIPPSMKSDMTAGPCPLDDGDARPRPGRRMQPQDHGVLAASAKQRTAQAIGRDL